MKPIVYAAPTDASKRYEPYVIKHSQLIKLIDALTTTRDFDTIMITSQDALGDTEAEFRESLRRICDAELFLLYEGKVHHPADLPMLPWNG